MKHSRRSLLRSLGVGPIGMFAGQACLPGKTPLAMSARSASARARLPERPNVILIVADDLRADDIDAMPAVQALLCDEGLSFGQCIVTTPSCAPSRASILRGQYPQNHGVRRGGEQAWGFGRFHALGHESSTIATWLQDAGYRTALIGKYINNYPSGAAVNYLPPGWDEWGALTQGGYTDFELNENGSLVHYDRRDRHYSTDILSTKAADFVSSAAALDAPFFLYLAPHAPHGPTRGAARFEGAFANALAPRPPSFNEEDVTDKSSWVQTIASLDADSVADVDDVHRGRMETLLAFDELIGNLVRSLDEAGALANTYIILTSDNGYHLGEHRIVAGKGTIFEEAIRVPLIVRGPGVSPGQTQSLTSLIDLAPTIAAWTDTPIPDFVDGRPLTLGHEATSRQAILVQLHRDNPEKNDGPPAFQALRGNGIVFAEYGDGERALFDLDADPYQLTNLAPETGTATLDMLSTRLAALSVCSGQSCRVAEDARLDDWRVASGASS